MIDYYRGLLDDPLRLEAFARALERTVREGDVVADVGCGLGTFSIFACRAGARRVLALESDPVLEVARRVVAANGCDDRVDFLAGSSEHLDVPERADVIVFEDFATTLLTPPMARMIRDVRNRWLAPGGRLIPASGRLLAAPVEDHQGWASLDRYAISGERLAGIDFGPARQNAFETVHLRHLQRGARLTEAFEVGRWDFAETETAATSGSADVTCERSGTVHGLLLWFEIDLAGQVLSTGPDAPSTPWKQNLFALERPVHVRRGQRIRLELASGEVGDELVWSWTAETADDTVRGSTFASLPVEADRLAATAPSRIPPVDGTLLADRVLLGLVDGSRSLREIAEEAVSQQPEQFTSVSEAIERARVLLDRL